MRSAEVVRDTLETKITVAINLDGTGVLVNFDKEISIW